MRIAIALAVALMAASHVSHAQAGERPEIADRIYEYVMGLADYYELLNEPKVMAICIDWDAPNKSGINIHNAFTTYTAIASNGPIFPAKLARDAKLRCNRWAKSENIDCTCQTLDSNGKNVLKVPAGK